MNFSQQLIQSYKQRFCNRMDVYGKQIIHGNDCRYEAVYEPLTPYVITNHLVGYHTIGFYSMDTNNASKWLCIDFDYEGSDAHKLVGLLRLHGWHCLREARRPGRDGHVWLFFDEPVPAVHLRDFAHLFLKQCAIPITKVEVFPKQNVLIKVGSLMRGPLGIHRKPGANNIRGWFDEVPQELIAQLEWLQAQPFNRSTDLLKSAKNMADRRLISDAISKGPAKKVPAGSASNKIDWLEYAIGNGFRHRDQFWYGPCPSCKNEGHDRHDDHLYVHNRGGIGCWRGCSFNDIVRAARGQ